jgi:hypothetical protein
MARSDDVLLAAEVEQVRQVANRRRVDGNIGVSRLRDRVRQVVAATLCERLESPVLLDKLEKRDVVVVCEICPPTLSGDTTMIGMRVPSPK